MFGQDEGGSAQGSPASGAMRQGGLEASRRRMQEEMDARAAQYRMKQQELEDQRRRQKIDRTLKMPVALRH